MALAAIADDGDLLPLDQIEIGIPIVIDTHKFFPALMAVVLLGPRVCDARRRICKWSWPTLYPLGNRSHQEARMKNIDRWFILIGLLYGIFGFSFGIWVGINERFEQAHLHAHINLIGFASMIAVRPPLPCLSGAGGEPVGGAPFRPLQSRRHRLPRRHPARASAYDGRARRRRLVDGARRPARLPRRTSF